VTEENKWKPNPALGGEHIEARKREAVEHLKFAADVAYYHIDQQLEADIADLRKKAGEAKSKIMTYIRKADETPALTVVRKYWQKDRDALMHHLTDTIMRGAEK